MAPSVAFSVSMERISRSTEGNISRVYASSAARRTYSAAGLSGISTRRKIMPSAFSRSAVTATFSLPSRSPRLTARI